MRTGSGIALLLALVLAAFLAGCGGGGGAPSGARTQATVTINWPERTRAIPLNAESLLVKLSDTDGFDAVQIADRPVDGGPSTLVVEVPVGRLFVTAAAYPAQQATGNALAVASSEVTTQAGVSTPFALTLQSTVASLAIGAESVTIDVGASRHLTATPLDAAGVAVLCAPENLTWTSSDPAVLAVDPYGNIRGMAAGTATVTVRESDSGLTATLPLTVRVGPNGLPSEAVLQEEVVVLPTDGSVTVQQTAGNTLVLGGASPTLQPGDIIVHDQPSYLLAKVVSATRTRSGDMMVETAPAAIEEAFRELDIDLSKTALLTDAGEIIPLDSDIMVTSGAPASRWGADISTQLLGTNIAFSHRLSPLMTAQGNVFVGLHVRFALRVHLGIVEYLKAELTPEVAATATLRSSPGTLSINWSNTGAEIKKVIPVWGPIFVMPRLTLGSKFTVSGEAFREQAFSGRYGMSVGVEYTAAGGLRGYADRNGTFTSDFRPGTQAVSVSATYFPITLNGSLLIQGIAGPTVGVGPYVRGVATVQSSTSYAFDLRYGLQASAGLTAGLGGIFQSLSHLSVSWSWTLADVSSSFPGYPKTLTIYGDDPAGSGGGTGAPGGIDVTIGDGPGGGGGVTPGGIDMTIN